VQFAYGLQQFRTLPIEERPAAFVTPAGSEIKVLQRIAERNDKAMKAGTVRLYTPCLVSILTAAQAIHKKLEVELYQEAVLVETESDEERWALRLVQEAPSVVESLTQCRLLDFLVRLQPLQHDGICVRCSHLPSLEFR
jgi:exonuclease V